MRFRSASVLRDIKNKKRLNIDFDENHDLTKQKLFVIQTDAQRLEYYNDTTTAIVVHFSEEVDYGEFVQLVNILYKSRISRYAWVDDSMIIIGNPKY
ncbi:MAG: hypothetical protein JWQ09_3841 [Segetibacter sp.]|nr:hypothetical protein [Segetibacter sp.]